MTPPRAADDFPIIRARMEELQRKRAQVLAEKKELFGDPHEAFGADAYEAAGGAITRDLFSGDEDGFMDDATLVTRLASEKLEAKAAELRPQWAWTKAVLDPEYGFMAQYSRIRPQPAEVPAELAAEIERIEQRLAELEEIDPDAWTDELGAEADQLEQRREEIHQTIDGLAVYSDKHRARAGCIVTIGEDGDFCLHQGLVERKVRSRAEETGDDGNQPMPASDEGDEGPGPSPGAEQLVRKECGFSQLLVDDLKAHRLQITRSHLAGDFAVAFDLALYALCVDLFERFGYRSHPLDLRAAESEPRSSLNDLGDTPADRLRDARQAALDLGWLKLPPAEGFAALAALPESAKQRLFAWCIAATLKPQLAIEDRADPVVECVGRRLAIPFADFWRPTAANYWGRVKKAHGLAIGAAILGDRWARDTRYLDRAIAALRRAEDVPDQLLAHLSPLGWEHVNLTGDYIWSAERPATENSDGFRPLRAAPDAARKAA